MSRGDDVSGRASAILAGRVLTLYSMMQLDNTVPKWFFWSTYLDYECAARL